MARFRISLGLVLFGLAGLAVLTAWQQDAEEGVLAWLGLWAAAAFLVWQGVRAFSGRIAPPSRPSAPQPQTPSSGDAAAGSTPPPTPPPAPGYREVARTAVRTTRSATLFMNRFVIVLLLVLLVPMVLGLLIGGVVLLVKGNLFKAAFALLAGGCLAHYCLGPLRELWHDDGGDDEDAGQAPQQPRGPDAVSGDEAPSTAPTDDPEPALTFPPPALTLPEEFLLYCHLEHGEVHNVPQAAVGCAAAELGELALRGRLRVQPSKKGRVFGFRIYFSGGRIHVRDAAPTGLDWADPLLAELERRTTAEGRPPSLRRWLKERSEEALTHHRSALLAHEVLRHTVRGELHYPDTAVRNALAQRLRAANSEHTPMDAHALVLLDLVDGADLEEHLGLTLTTRQRLDRAKGLGALAPFPEELKDTSTVLGMHVPSGPASGGSAGSGEGGGDGDGGE